MVASVLITLKSAGAIGKSESSLHSHGTLIVDQQVVGWGNQWETDIMKKQQRMKVRSHLQELLGPVFQHLKLKRKMMDLPQWL